MTDQTTQNLALLRDTLNQIFSDIINQLQEKQVALQDLVDATVLKAGSATSIPSAPNANYPALYFVDDFKSSDYPGGFQAALGTKWSSTLPGGARTLPNSQQGHFDDTNFSLATLATGETVLQIAASKTASGGLPYSTGLICSYPNNVFKLLPNGPFWLEVKLKCPVGTGLWPFIYLFDPNQALFKNEIDFLLSGSPVWNDGRTEVSPNQFAVLQYMANAGAVARFNFFKTGTRTFSGSSADPAPNTVTSIPAILDCTSQFVTLSLEWTGTKFVAYYNRSRVWEWDLNGVNDPTNQKSDVGGFIPQNNTQGMALALGLSMNGSVGNQEFIGNVANDTTPGGINNGGTVQLLIDYVAVWQGIFVPQNPVPGNDTYTTNTDTALVVPVASGVLANDQDPNGGTLSVSRWDAVSAQGFPISSTGSDGHFTYTPSGGFNGTDTFTYDVVSSKAPGKTATGSVSIGVNATVPDPLLGSSTTLASGATYKLVAHDEFHGVANSSLNGLLYHDKHWITTFFNGADRTLTGNGEAQYYMDPFYNGQDGTRTWNNVANRNVDCGPLGSPNGPKSPGMYNPFVYLPDPSGVLQISSFPIATGDLSNFWAGPGREFCSGMICSHPDIHKWDRPFDKNPDGVTCVNGGWLVKAPCYFEARIKLPRNFGSWPAFWILTTSVPDNYTFTAPKTDFWGRVNELNAPGWYGWGASEGENDFFEFFGHRPTKHSCGTHPGSGQASTFTLFDEGFDLTTDYHVWGCEIDLTNTRWYLDGRLFKTFQTVACFKPPHQMYVIVNCAMGGNWFKQETGAAATDAVDTTSMPWHMLVDYVRVYK